MVDGNIDPRSVDAMENFKDYTEEAQKNMKALQTQMDKFTNAKSDFWGMIWLADYPDPQNFLQLFNGAMVPGDSEPSYTNASRYINPIFDQFYIDFWVVSNLVWEVSSLQTKILVSQNLPQTFPKAVQNRGSK